MKIPDPPGVLKLDVPPVVRRFPLSRSKLKTAEVIEFLKLFAWVGAVAGVASFFLPVAATIMWSSAVAVLASLLLILYRWIVACPVCENGFGTALPITAFQCPNCDAEYDADDTVTSATPWGGTGTPK